MAGWISDAAREEARRILEQLRPGRADLKWVEPENLHVTIRFLGETPDSAMPRIASAVAAAADSVAPFAIGLGRLGVFESRGAARVVRAAVSPGDAECAALAERVESHLAADGLVSPETRPFRAHVTLGRARGEIRTAQLLPRLERLAFASPAEPLEEIRLVESRRTPQGPQYHVQERFPLRGKQGSPKRRTRKE